MNHYRVHLMDPSNNPSHSPREWDEFVSASPWGHILQTCRWGRFKERFGWHPLVLQLIEGERIIGGAQVLLRRLPLGRTMAYIPRGPVLPPDRPDLVRLVLQQALAHARQHRAILLKVEPAWSDKDDISSLWPDLGMRRGRTVQPRSTILLDLAGSEDDWLHRMKQKTRYNIRLSKRKGVQIREGNLDDLPAFHRLMGATAQRDHFPARDLSYYREVWQLFALAGLATLLLATYEGEVLAGLMPFACGRTAWYLYGASSNRHRNRMPNYALQWAAMRWAKSQGCKTYDLWGIPDEIDTDQNGPSPSEATDKQGAMWGVYRFKQGFGGQTFRTAGSYDAVLSPSLYWTYRQVQTLRHWKQGVR